MKKDPHFITFKHDVTSITLPEKFTFPFYYEPHPLSKIAATELQNYLETQTDWEHNFGLKEGQQGLIIGKMFGVLVVQNQQGELGYLAAFSGKLADSNEHQHFVPPVFDMLKQDGFFKKEEKILNEYNRKIEALAMNPDFLEAKKQWVALQVAAEKDKLEKKEATKQNKQLRDALRAKSEKEDSFEVYKALQKQLSQQSREESIQLKMMNHYWTATLAAAQESVTLFQSELDALKEERKQLSAQLQQKLFEQYSFLKSIRNNQKLGNHL